MHAQHLSDLVMREADEVVELDHLGLALVERAERVQRLAQLDELGGVFACDGGLVQDRRAPPVGALGRAAPARVVDEYLPHEAGRDREEMDPVVERQGLSRQAKVGLVDEIARSQRVSGPLAPDVALGQATELVVHEGQELIERRRVSAAPPPQQRGHRVGPSSPHVVEIADYALGAEGVKIGRPPSLRRYTRVREVMVDFLIGEEGEVAHAEIRRSIPQLDAAALACVRRWEFEPMRVAGVPRATLARAPVKFRIY
jgi:TonB family protein